MRRGLGGGGGVSTPVSVANGGTGATDASTARTNLGITSAGNVTPVFGGRLTLTSGTPVLTTDTTGATTIYYALYTSDQVPIYDGSAFVSTTFTELSLALGTLTSGANYDVFVYLVSTTPTLILGPAWSSNTARGTGAGTTELERVKGVWLNKVSISGGPAANRGTYLGTIRTTSTTATGCRFGQATGSTGGQWYVWNVANRVPVDLTVFEATGNWTYGTNTIRQANAASGNKVEYVAGLATEPISALVSGQVTCGVGTNIYAVGVGVDSTTVDSSHLKTTATSTSNAQEDNPTALYFGQPGAGYHAINWLESCYGSASPKGTWGGVSPSNSRSGMSVRIFA